MLKRTAWTTNEVIAITKEMGLILDRNDKLIMDDPHAKIINDHILLLCKMWEDFSLPDKHIGAVAYNIVDKAIEHIGELN